jgi:hypothetical protein
MLYSIWKLTKQWPLAPNSRDSRVTRANLSRRVTFFSKTAFGECRRVWRVRATQLGECCQVWRVRATRLGKCWPVWQVRATRLGASAHDKIGCFKQSSHLQLTSSNIFIVQNLLSRLSIDK